MPLKDVRTGQAKKIDIASSGTGKIIPMIIKGIVYVFDAVEECNTLNCDVIGTNLVREANSTFGIKIGLGGNSSHFGKPELMSIDSKFLAEDVANLAMMSYREAIENHSFFQDDVLVSKYFLYCPDVQELFASLFGV